MEVVNGNIPPQVSDSKSSTKDVDINPNSIKKEENAPIKSEKSNGSSSSSSKSHSNDPKKREEENRKRKAEEMKRAEHRKRVKQFKEAKLRARKDHAKDILEMQKRRKLFTKPSEFLCPMKFRNKLPDIPFEPKFLNYPHEPDRLIKYKPNTLECEYEYELHMEPNLGLTIDLIDPDNREVPTTPAQLPEADTEIFNMPDDSEQEEKASGKLRPAVTWLRRTEYMGNDLYDSVHKFKTEISIQDEMQNKLRAELEGPTLSPLEKAIQTFEDIEKDETFVHPYKKKMKAARIWNLLPDDELYANEYSMMQFEILPSMDGKERNEEIEALQTRALVRNVEPVKQAGGLSSLIGSLLLPKTQSDKGFEKFQYYRDYQLSVKQIPQLFFFSMDPNKNDATYFTVDSRIELKKFSTKKKREEKKRIRNAILRRRPLSEEEEARHKEILTSVGGKYEKTDLSINTESNDEETKDDESNELVSNKDKDTKEVEEKEEAANNPKSQDEIGSPEVSDASSPSGGDSDDDDD